MLRTSGEEAMNRVVATIAGIAAMIGVILVVETAAHMIFPTADGPDMAAILAAMPLGAKLAVVFGWFAGPLVGTWLAARMSSWAWAPRIVTGLAIVGGVATVVTIRHPWWMVLASVLAPLGGLVAGIRLAGRATP
jgi:hypothetical protein